MSSITAYQLLEAGGADELETLVAAAIAEGWQPFSESVIRSPARPKYVQAMVKYDGDNFIVSPVITITSAQMLALNAAPQTLVAAPGAGKAIVPVYAALFLDYGTAAYAGIAAGEDLAFRYTNGSGTTIGTVEANGFLDATADAHRLTTVFSGLLTPTANAALVLHMTSGEITTGDSPLKVKVGYRVVELPT